jgi:hypothetical protein
MADAKDSTTQRNGDEIKDSSSEMRAIAPTQSSQNIELVAFDGIEDEPVKVRSRVRIVAIMTALNVSRLSSVHNYQLTRTISWQCSSSLSTRRLSPPASRQ